jgi:hypothetical protein
MCGIYSGGPTGAIYVMAGGKWTRTKMTSADMMSKQEENRRAAKDTCHAVREESVNGEAATVYSSHSDTEGSKVDSTVWIFKSKGLSLKRGCQYRCWRDGGDEPYVAAV